MWFYRMCRLNGIDKLIQKNYVVILFNEFLHTSGDDKQKKIIINTIIITFIKNSIELKERLLFMSLVVFKMTKFEVNKDAINMYSL
jgi:hypothetical protein